MMSETSTQSIAPTQQQPWSVQQHEEALAHLEKLQEQVSACADSHHQRTTANSNPARCAPLSNPFFSLSLAKNNHKQSANVCGG